MRPRKFVAKGSRYPKINLDKNIPFKVALAFFLLGFAVVILTITLVALIVSVKARFDGLTASINSLTMKDEFAREYDKFTLSRKAIERQSNAQIKILENKEKNGNHILDRYKILDETLNAFEKDLLEFMPNVTQRYANYMLDTREEFKQKCKRLLDRSEEINNHALILKKKVDDLDYAMKGIEPKIFTLKEYIKDLFPKNFQYYQLGGYPSPEILWPFLKWTHDLIVDRTFIQISHDEKQFGQIRQSNHKEILNSAFELEFIPVNTTPEVGYFNLKMTPGGNQGLKPDFNDIDELSPPSRRITIWKLQN